MILNKVLQSLRKQKIINAPVRGLLKYVNKFQSHWPVSGVIDCRFDDIDFRLYNECDDNQVGFFYYGNHFHESSIIKTVVAFARKSKCIVDIGANTGIHSIIAARSNPALKIYSIEPYRPNYLRFETNKSLNKCNNIEIVTTALGSAEGELKMYVPHNDKITDVSSADNAHGNRIYPEVKWKETTVKQTTFDALSKVTGKIDFFKCDVESHEIEVIKGAMEFFELNRPPFLMEICLNEEKCEFFNSFLRKYGYTIYFIGENGFTKLESLYDFDRWPNFLFTQYNHPRNFIPFRDLADFVEKC